MGMRREFEEAVEAVKQINFTICALDEINVFETNIRYLGAFLAANDLTGGQYPILRKKAEEVGWMLYKAFDTPNRLPITRWNIKDAKNGFVQEAPESVLLAEIGSLSLEFTRLSQITYNRRFYTAAQQITNILEAQQIQTKIPGLWPVVVNARTQNFTEFGGFTIAGMADSTYEYLPKVRQI
jgi:mannosyl-oligosaccharide alpha-1,2-mannosidase